MDVRPFGRASHCRLGRSSISKAAAGAAAGAMALEMMLSEIIV